MIVCRSWKAPTAPSGPRTCSARARHDDTPSRPHDLGHRPLSQRSFLWPKRLTAGGAAANEASSGAVGPGEALGTLVTISGYVKRPRYARLNTPMGADGAISCMSCASYQPPCKRCLMSSLPGKSQSTSVLEVLQQHLARPSSVSVTWRPKTHSHQLLW